MSGDESTSSPGGEVDFSKKLLRARELYSHGSRNLLVKSYADAADELSEVCAIYEEVYGELSDELGMPYLLYAKSLIALAMDENKVIDVPDEEDDDGDDDDDDEDAEAMETDGAAPSTSKNGVKLEAIKENAAEVNANRKDGEAVSSNAAGGNGAESDVEMEEAKAAPATAKPKATPVDDGEQPSTSNGSQSTAEKNGDQDGAEEDEDENASSLQLAWEILELAAKIFSRQGMGGLPNLAEVQTELANIEFENNIVDAAREDYAKALQIYKELPTHYRRNMAEINYKIGLTYLMESQMKEGAASMKEACQLIQGEIDEIKAKAKPAQPSEKDKNNIREMELTKQEIWAKIAEIEEAQVQNIAEVRAALDSYIKPISTMAADGSGPSGSSAAETDSDFTSSSSAADVAATSPTAAGASSSTASAATITSSSSSSCNTSSSSSSSSSSKPKDISHLIKRKKPEEAVLVVEAEAVLAAASPAKRPTV